MGNYKRYNIYIIGIPENKEKTKEIFETIMTKNLMSDTKPPVQETPRIPSRINVKITTPKPIIFKLQKTYLKFKTTQNLLGYNAPNSPEATHQQPPTFL